MTTTTPTGTVTGTTTDDFPWELDCRDAGPVTWELVELDHMPMVYPGSLAAAHVADTDLDGRLDGRDHLGVVIPSWEELGLYDLAEGVVFARREVPYETIQFPAYIGDLDGMLGAEAVAAPLAIGGAPADPLYLLRSGSVTAVLDYSDLGLDDGIYDLLLVDWNGDAAPDILSSLDDVVFLTDMTTGVTSVLAQSRAAVLVTDIAVADLDRDGVPDLLAADGAVAGDGGDLGIVGADGSVPNPCLTSTVFTNVTYAVGNLDDDDDGEFVLMVRDALAVCDADGTLIRSIATELFNQYNLAIGDLDGDGQPEIVLSADHGHELEFKPPRLQVYDPELNFLWEIPEERFVTQAGFSLADLDADGDHELVYTTWEGLEVADGDGTVLATWTAPGGTVPIGPSDGTPIVVDIDGDGLSEILVTRHDGVYVLSTPSGGFPVHEGGRGWSGRGHYPGKLALDGTLDRELTPWLKPQGNAWNAHPVCPVGTTE